MSDAIFRWFNGAIAFGFCCAFLWLVVPALMAEFDIVGAFAAGFVNPYAAGYSTDVVLCWAALAGWVWHEARTAGVRHGWICVLLGIVPGVAVGLPLYLILRNQQLEPGRCKALTASREDANA
ncbi:MAG: DUF2834 domain-containing protein [Pseudomonadaceae bacterium]|nr:DUF2834 domain-containing protein [Pseudomonadaceae bacterium]